MNKTLSIILYSISGLWLLWGIIGILLNYSNYGILDWILIIIIVLFPLTVTIGIHQHYAKVNNHKKTGFRTSTPKQKPSNVNYTDTLNTDEKLILARRQLNIVTEQLNEMSNHNAMPRATAAIQNSALHSDRPLGRQRVYSFSQDSIPHVHPDFINLLWFGDGPYKNYINEKKNSNTFYINGFTFHISTYGAEEPSLIYESLPVAAPRNMQDVPRPPYYPSYKELSPEQRLMYLKFLESPYNGDHDIGYVFIFYYGLERHLFSAQANSAFEVILKLRDCYSNKSFQSYSGAALILYTICQKDIFLAQKFLNSLDKKFEMQIPAQLFILLKYCLKMPLTSFEIMQYSKAFLFDNQRYIKSNPEIFLGFLQDEIKSMYANDFLPLADLLANADATNVTPVDVPLFANISIIDKVVRIPDFLSYMPFVTEVNLLLKNAHEKTKKQLALMRKLSK